MARGARSTDPENGRHLPLTSIPDQEATVSWDRIDTMLSIAIPIVFALAVWPRPL